jgi:flagellar basal-body rod protein FlgB
MIENLDIVRLASQMARHAAARHMIVAENIANADTPNFQARDLAAFDPSEPGGFRARTTHPGHVVDMRPQAVGGRPIELDYTTSSNGNTVSLEDQIVRSADIQKRHELAVTLYRKSLDLLRLGLGRIR